MRAASYIGGLDDVIFLILNDKLPSLGTSNVSLLIQKEAFS